MTREPPAGHSALVFNIVDAPTLCARIDNPVVSCTLSDNAAVARSAWLTVICCRWEEV